MVQATSNTHIINAAKEDDEFSLSSENLEGDLVEGVQKTRLEYIIEKLANTREEVSKKLDGGLDNQQKKVATALLKAIDHAKQLLSSI